MTNPFVVPHKHLRVTRAKKIMNVNRWADKRYYNLSLARHSNKHYAWSHIVKCQFMLLCAYLSVKVV